MNAPVTMNASPMIRTARGSSTPRSAEAANGARVPAGTTVQFSVYSPIARDLAVFIRVPTASGSERIAPFGYSVASGVLPVRTPSDAYLSLQLRGQATTVTREQIAATDFLVAGTRMSAERLMCAQLTKAGAS